MFVILAKKVVYDYEEVLPFIMEGKKVIELVDDGDGEYFNGRIVTEDNYDDVVAEFWKDKWKQWTTLFCDVMVFENESIVNVPKGEYEIGIVGKLK